MTVRLSSRTQWAHISNNSGCGKVGFVIRVDVESVGPASPIARCVASRRPLGELDVSTRREVILSGSQRNGIAQSGKEQAADGLKPRSGTHGLKCSVWQKKE